MPKIMESFYQGYLQNLEAGRNKQTRLPVATQYKEKAPEERNDFDRFCALIELMRGKLGSNVPFGGESFSIGYYNLSRVRNYEIGEVEFEELFGDLWDNLETELDKHKDVVAQLKPEEKAAVQAVLDIKAKEREEPKLDLNETIQYGDQLNFEGMNETVLLTEEQLRELNEELEKKQTGEKKLTGDPQEPERNDPQAGLNETVLLTEEQLKEVNEELEKKQTGEKKPTNDLQEPVKNDPKTDQNAPKAGMESFYQGYLQNLEAGRNKQTRFPVAMQYKDKNPEELNDFDRFCALIGIMRDKLGPNVPFGGEGFSIGYYNLSKVRNYEIGKVEFEELVGNLWDNLETELDKHKDVVARLKPEEKAAVQAVLDIKAKEREQKERELDDQIKTIYEDLMSDQQPTAAKKTSDEELDRERERLFRELTGDLQPETDGKAANEPDAIQTDYITAALRQAGMTEQEIAARDSSRLIESRSREFGGVVDALTSMAAYIAHNGNNAKELRAMIDGNDGLTERCIDYLKKYPKVRATQSGRDSYDLVLNTLAVFGDPKDKRIQACLDGVNKVRGVSGRKTNKDFVDLKNYGADRLTGKAKTGVDVLRDIDKQLVAQAKLAKKRDAAAQVANAQLKHLQLKKLYLKALVAPNGVVDPKSLDAQTAELGRNTALNNALAAAAKDPKMQDRIMAAEVNKLRGRRERNEFYEKAPEAPQRKNEDPQRGGPKLGG